MTPFAHLATSWSLGALSFKEKRDRILLTLSGIAPDLDGLGIVVDFITKETQYYHDYHHYHGHNIFFIIAISALLAAFSKTSFKKLFIFCFISMQLHMLCDLAGSGATSGYIWPIYYLYPYSDKPFTWSGQWPLNSIHNLIYMLILFIFSAYTARKKSITFLEIFGEKFNAATVKLFSRLWPQ